MLLGVTGGNAGYLERLPTFHRPPFDRKDNNSPSHEHGRKSHRHSKREHSVQVVMFHSRNGIFVAGHEYQTARYEAEGANDLRRWA